MCQYWPSAPLCFLMFTCQWHLRRMALPVLCVSNSPPIPPGSSGLSLCYNGSSWRYPRTNANSNTQVHKLQLQAGFTAFFPECSAVFGRIYSHSCSTKWTWLLSCRPKLGLCKLSRVSLVLGLVGCVDTGGCICIQMSSNDNCSKILLQQWCDQFKGWVLNLNLSVPSQWVVFIIMSLLITCNYFPITYFSIFQCDSWY